MQHPGQHIQKNIGYPKCFISYRHSDANQSALWLAMDLAGTFGPNTVFLDTDGIEGGEVWRTKILTELRGTSVVLALIGMDWLRSHDKYWRRRIDQEDDWVRMELSYAIDNNKTIIPLLVKGATMPDADALPTNLRSLSGLQAIPLHPSDTNRSHLEVIEALEKNGFRRRGVTDFDRPEASPPAKVAGEETIEQFLNEHEAWAIVHKAGKNGRWRVGLVRDFTFTSFVEALGFMKDAAGDIAHLRHYPEWENVWRTVRVWYTTWDLGHVISDNDLKMARQLDNIYKHYKARLELTLRGDDQHND